MPQMSPMLWSLLFIYFIFLFIFFNILNYFNFIPSSMMNLTTSTQNSFNKKFLTWKW